MRLHRVAPTRAPVNLAASWTSDALPRQASCLVTALLVRPVVRSPRLLRPLLTSRSASSASGLHPQDEISSVKNAFFHRTTVASMSPRLDHKSFENICPLELLGAGSYAPRVPRLPVCAPRFLPTLGLPHAVALHFARCGQLAGGLAPPGLRPCCAHK